MALGVGFGQQIFGIPELGGLGGIGDGKIDGRRMREVFGQHFAEWVFLAFQFGGISL